MGFLATFLLGKGTLKPKLREALESEGLVLVEEGLRGSVRYEHFKAPGRRHHGKITPERMALGISRERLVVYCRSGRVKLIDSEFTNPRLEALDVLVEGDDTVVFRVDYDRMGEPRISGVIKIVVRTPSARRIGAEVSRRLGRSPAEGA